MRAHHLLHETPSRLELAALRKPVPCQPHHPRPSLVLRWSA
jgi:hypothetical protein